MPYGNVRRLKRIQAGLEATRGTPVVATRRVYGNITRSHDQAIEEIPDEGGTFWMGESTVAADASIGFSLDAVCTYEDLPWWLHLALDGAITPTTIAGTPNAYAWLATPEGETDNLKTATFESGWGTLVYRSSRVVVNRMTISCNRADARYWKISGDLMARDVSVMGGGFTAAIPQRSRIAVLAPGTKLFLDAVGAIGTTEKTNAWRSFSVTIENNIDEKRFGESDAFVATDFGRGDQVVTGEVVFEWTDDVEYANQRNLVGRALRFQKEGPIIHTTVANRVRVNLPNIYWNAPSENIVGQNVVASYGFTAKPLAGAAPISIETQNSLATLP